jgi:hypothetical protein
MGLRERLAQREQSEPCFCEGPWRDEAPSDRPESVLAREHELESAGCERLRRVERFPARDFTGQVVMR